MFIIIIIIIIWVWSIVKVYIICYVQNLIIILFIYFFFFWIWSIIKVYIICYIPVQIPCVGKISFLRYRLKYSKWWNSLIVCKLWQFHENFKLSKHFWVGWVKNLCGSSNNCWVGLVKNVRAHLEMIRLVGTQNVPKN